MPMSNDTAAARAQFYAPQKAFDRPVPKVPATIFQEERNRAFADGQPTGKIDLDQSRALGCSWPATTPTMLARYIIVLADESYEQQIAASGLTHYVLRGNGTISCDDESFTWQQDDAFCLPGGVPAKFNAQTHSIILQVGNEPELSYLRARPAANSELRPTLFRAAETERLIGEVHAREDEQLAAGKSVVFLSQQMADRRVTTPTILSSINTLEPGGDQRAHRHSSAALTLALACEGVYSVVDGIRIDWQPGTVIVTPPNAVHSHHNRGPAMMKSFVAQDTGLHAQLRTTNFSWTE
jgi:gentisate 1,2-dioxygenase